MRPTNIHHAGQHRGSDPANNHAVSDHGVIAISAAIEPQVIGPDRAIVQKPRKEPKEKLIDEICAKWRDTLGERRLQELEEKVEDGLGVSHSIERALRDATKATLEKDPTGRLAKTLRKDDISKRVEKELEHIAKEWQRTQDKKKERKSPLKLPDEITQAAEEETLRVQPLPKAFTRLYSRLASLPGSADDQTLRDDLVQTHGGAALNKALRTLAEEWCNLPDAAFKKASKEYLVSEVSAMLGAQQRSETLAQFVQDNQVDPAHYFQETPSANGTFAIGSTLYRRRCDTTSRLMHELNSPREDGSSLRDHFTQFSERKIERAVHDIADDWRFLPKAEYENKIANELAAEMGERLLKTRLAASMSR